MHSEHLPFTRILSFWYKEEKQILLASKKVMWVWWLKSCPKLNHVIRIKDLWEKSQCGDRVTWLERDHEELGVSDASMLGIMIWNFSYREAKTFFFLFSFVIKIYSNIGNGIIIWKCCQEVLIAIHELLPLSNCNIFTSLYVSFPWTYYNSVVNWCFNC